MATVEVVEAEVDAQETGAVEKLVEEEPRRPRRRDGLALAEEAGSASEGLKSLCWALLVPSAITPIAICWMAESIQVCVSPFWVMGLAFSIAGLTFAKRSWAKSILTALAAGAFLFCFLTAIFPRL